MTLIVGIVCKDAIVLAADSQTTYFPSKILGTNKISAVNFSNGKALVAEAGLVSLSNTAVHIFQNKAKATEIKDEETVAKVCQQAVQEIRQHQISLFPRRKYSLEEWKAYFRDQSDFILTVAYYFNDKPYLYNISLNECTLHKITSEFSATGCGESFGNYLLKQESDHGEGFKKMDSDLASVIAIKVADAAAEYVDGCGRPIKVALIQPPMPVPDFLDALRPANDYSSASAGYTLSRPSYLLSDPITIFPKEKVEEIAKIISSVERKLKVSQNKKIHLALRSQTEKLFKSITKMLRAGRGLGRTKSIAPALLDEANRQYLPAKGAKKTNE